MRTGKILRPFYHEAWWYVENMLKFHKMQEHYSVEWQNDVWETERIGGIYKSGRGRNRKLIESGRERGAVGAQSDWSWLNRDENVARTDRSGHKRLRIGEYLGINLERTGRERGENGRVGAWSWCSRERTWEERGTKIYVNLADLFLGIFHSFYPIPPDLLTII